MESNEEVKEVVNSSTESEQIVETSQNKKEKEEVKAEKTYSRDEVNKIINAERQQERDRVLKEVEAKKAEADKLAKMDEDQKRDYQLQEALKRANEAESKLSARDLEAETLKQANDKGIPLELISTIDFTKETAESILSKLDVFEKTAKAVRERAINEYSKEPAPRTGDKVDTTETPKSYEEWDKYYKEHPNAN